MFQSVRRRRKSQAPEIRMAPLIDMVFILLVFFMLTATFFRETGIEIDKPHSRTRQQLERSAVVIGVDVTGAVFLENERVALRELAAGVRRALASGSGRGVVIVADRGAAVESLVEVMDEARVGGAERIAVATEREDR